MQDEIDKMKTMKDVFDWAGFQGDDLGSDQSVGGTLAKLLGINGTEHPRVLALVEDADFSAMIQKWKVAKTEGGNVTYAAPTMAEVGKAKLVLRACRVVSGTDATIADLKKQLQQAQSAPGPQPVQAPSSSAERRIKLSAILSQVDDSEAQMMSEKDMVAAYLRYATVFGSNERPPKESEPTVEQLSALRHVVQQGNPPFVDFSIWGPYGHRLVKKIKLSGYVIGRDGVLSTVELTGPTNFGMWLQSWQVFSNVCIMLDIIDLGTLTKYRDTIEKFHNRYGHAIWALLYQADTRFRLELVDRVRRQVQAEEEELKKAQGQGAKLPGYDPTRPWNYIYQKAINLESYWREEVVEPSMLVLTKISGLGEVIDGDAKIKGDQQASGQHGRDTGPAPGRMVQSSSSQAAPKLRPRNSNRTGRHHSVADGKYLLNRTGYSLCAAYNEGRCEGGSNGGWCPQSWDTVHQCSRCLGTHPLTKCHHDSMPQPKFLSSQGKGRGKRWQRWQTWAWQGPAVLTGADERACRASRRVRTGRCSSEFS